MQTYRFIAMIVISGFFAGIVGIGIAAEDGASPALNGILMDIHTAEQVIRQRVEMAERVRQRLLYQVDELKAEINRERQHSLSTAFPAVLPSSRIDYDLRLLQRLFVYIERIEHRIDCDHSAVYTLDFFRRQIQDDMLFHSALHDADIAGVMHQLTDELKRFTSLSDKPLPSASNSGPRSLESIWKDILQGK